MGLCRSPGKESREVLCEIGGGWALRSLRHRTGAERLEELREELDEAWIRVGEAAEEASGDIFDERVDAACEGVREISRAIDRAAGGQPLCEVLGEGPADMMRPDDRVLAGARVARNRLMKGRRIVDENGAVRVVRPE